MHELDVTVLHHQLYTCSLWTSHLLIHLVNIYILYICYFVNVLSLRVYSLYFFIVYRLALRFCGLG